LRQLTAAAATRSAPRRRTGRRRQDQHWNIGVNVQFLIDNIILIAVAFFSGAMLVWPAIRGRASGPSLSTLQATQLINARNPQIVDLRSADDFAKGSLPNARNLPSDKLNDRIGDLKKDKPGAETLRGLLLGPTGNLRAPTLRKGRTLVVGFDEATYAKLLK